MPVDFGLCDWCQYRQLLGLGKRYMLGEILLLLPKYMEFIESRGNHFPLQPPEPLAKMYLEPPKSLERDPPNLGIAPIPGRREMHPIIPPDNPRPMHRSGWYNQIGMVWRSYHHPHTVMKEYHHQ